MIAKTIKHIRQGTLLPVLARKIGLCPNLTKDCYTTDTVLHQGIDEALTKFSHGEDDGYAILQLVFNNQLSGYSGLPMEYIKHLLRAIHETLVLANPRAKLGEGLCYDTDQLKPSCLPFDRWLLLRQACIRSGLFRVGAIARDKAIKSAYDAAAPGKADEHSLMVAVKAALDQGDVGRMKDLHARLRPGICTAVQLRDLDFMLYLVTKDTASVFEHSRVCFEASDWRFREYLHGRSVAVVGPAPTVQDTGFEIDTFDVVLRFTYRGGDFLPAARKCGSRTNVSYYNIENAKKIGELQPYFDDLDYAVFKSETLDYQRHLIKKRRGRIAKANNILFTGTANLLPLVLFDILHFAPSRVKVFSNNFFLANCAYHSGYKFMEPKGTSKASSITDVCTRWRSFSIHDPLSQVNFVRGLWDAGLIEVDETCEMVLRLTSAQYISALERIYVYDSLESLMVD